MSIVKVAATALTPDIEFDPQGAKISFIGEVYPENPLPFFDPIINTLRRYFLSVKPEQFDVVMRLNYVNSASTKAFRNLFLLFDEVGKGGTTVRIRWEHDPDDDAIEELGADLAADLHYIDLVHVEATA